MRFGIGRKDAHCLPVVVMKLAEILPLVQRPKRVGGRSVIRSAARRTDPTRFGAQCEGPFLRAVQPSLLSSTPL